MKKIPTLLFVKDKRKEWRWRFIHGNGKILAASSEGFSRKAGAARNFTATFLAMREFFVHGA